MLAVGLDVELGVVAAVAVAAVDSSHSVATQMAVPAATPAVAATAAIGVALVMSPTGVVESHVGHHGPEKVVVLTTFKHSCAFSWLGLEWTESRNSCFASLVNRE